MIEAIIAIGVIITATWMLLKLCCSNKPQSSEWVPYWKDGSFYAFMYVLLIIASIASVIILFHPILSKL